MADSKKITGLKTTSLQLIRNADGEVRYVGELPQRHVFSSGFIMSGGVEAAVREKAAFERDAADEKDADKAKDLRARAKKLNTAPLFDKTDGMDIVFHFKGDEEVRYRFVGFDTNNAGALNLDALVYELA